jgi:hypothetical protein
MARKVVRSDVKDVTPEQVDEANAEATDKDRHPTEPGERSDHIRREVPQGDNAEHGGSDRAERRGGTPAGWTKTENS